MTYEMSLHISHYISNDNKVVILGLLLMVSVSSNHRYPLESQRWHRNHFLLFFTIWVVGRVGAREPGLGGRASQHLDILRYLIQADVPPRHPEVILRPLAPNAKHIRQS